MTDRGEAVFARLATRPIPRVTRMMTIARDRGYRPTFIGALRDAAAPVQDSWDGFPLIRIGEHFPLVNGKGFATYARGVLRFNLALHAQLKARRPALIHASDFEASLGCVFYRLRHRAPLIYNIHDNLADRYSLPTALRRMLNVLEGLMVLLSSQALVPETFRRDSLPRWARAKVQVVRNSPIDTGWSEPALPADRIRVLYAGWLDNGRALAALLSLARENEWLEVRVAGEGDQRIIDRIAASGATYLGFLGHDAVMIETRRCHFVAAFYDPARPINRAAAPNKLAEALSCGRPVLINTEVLVAHAPSLANCAVRVPYADVASVAQLVKRVVDDDGGSSYRTMCREAREAYESDYAWSRIRTQVESLFSKFEG